MKALTQKAVLITAVIIGSLTVSTVAFAAGGMNQSSGPRINAGLVSNEACVGTKDSITLHYSAPFYDKTTQQYVVDGLNLASIDSSCEGLTISITIQDSSDAVVGEDTGTITGSTYSARFEPVNAAVIGSVALVIYRSDRARPV